MDNLSQLGGKKIEAKILMRKQLNNYDGVLCQLEGQEEDEENKAKNQKIKNAEDVKKSASKEKVAMKVSDKCKARWYELGFLQSKIIKNIFFCLSERQQIGKKIFLSQLPAV